MAEKKPNVIIITTDQQRRDSLSCYGSSFTSTPNISRLAEGGIVFDRGYCSNPVCTPARASIFTGKYVGRHGAWNVGMNVAPDERMLSRILAEEGYRTHYIGKAHFNSFGGKPGVSVEGIEGWEKLYPEFAGPYYGFEKVELSLGHGMWGMAGHYGAWVRSQVEEEEFRSLKNATRLGEHEFGGEAYDWDMPMKLHSSVWTAERTMEFLRNHDGTKPFLLGVGFQDPHHPHAVPREFDGRIDPAAVPMPDYDEGELDDKPGFFKEALLGKLEESAVRGDYWVAGQGAGFDFTQVDEREARIGRAYYYNLVRIIDGQMGRILDCLDETGLADDTIVVFTTDHGELLGDHGLWMKGPFHYEQLLRIPMIMRWPGGFAGGSRTIGALQPGGYRPDDTLLSGHEGFGRHGRR